MHHTVNCTLTYLEARTRTVDGTQQEFMRLETLVQTHMYILCTTCNDRFSVLFRSCSHPVHGSYGISVLEYYHAAPLTTG